MNNKKNRDFIFFIILIPLFLWSAFYISSRLDNTLPDYSCINKSKNGLSVFYESLKELNYPVERVLTPLEDCDPNSIQIVPAGISFKINDEEVKDWVSKGGTLVYLSKDPVDSMFLEGKAERKMDLIIYEHSNGKIISAFAGALTNKVLTKETQSAYNLVSEISSVGDKKIYFNESTIFSADSNKSLWDYIPLEGKFLFYQMAIALLAFFYYKGRRFGRTVPLHEEVERIENEYLYSSASLYRQAKCYDLIVESFYKSFLRLLKATHDNWLDSWENGNFPNISGAKKVHRFMDDPNKKPGVKEYIEIITIIEGLKNILKQRRDIHWKTIK